MKFVYLLFVSAMLSACSESEPPRDPVLDDLDTYPKFNALEIESMLSESNAFDRKYEGQLIVIEGVVSQVSLKRVQDNYVMYISSGRKPIFCEFKKEQEYYKYDYGMGKEIIVVGKAHVDRIQMEDGEHAYLSLSDAVIIRD